MIVTEANLNHENHLCDQVTYDHYPENLRLSNEAVEKAKEMIEVGGNKQKMKSYLTKRYGKPVLLKTLHNLQTAMQKNKIPQVDELQQLYDILSEIPNANMCFVCDDNDDFVGKAYASQLNL